MNTSFADSIQWYRYRWLIVAILTLLIMSAAGIQEVHAEAKQVTSSSSSSSSSSFPDKKAVTSGNYSGVGQLIRVDDNTYWVDEGEFETLSKTASDSASQSGSAACGETVGSTIPGSISYSDGDGYSGTLSQTSYSYSDTTGTDCVPGGSGSYSFSRSASYSGTVSKQVWVENWVRHGSYDAAYSAYLYTQDTIQRTLGQAANCVCKADPINMINGNFILTEPDLSVNDRGASIEIKRYYNSQDDESGLFGKGWRFEYESSVAISGDGTAIVTYPHGRKIYFTQEAGTNVYKAGLTVFDVLTKNSDQTYSLRLKDNSMMKYSAQGKLISIVDPNQNQSNLEYDTSGNLTKITSPGGKSVDVTMQQGKISEIRDGIGRKIVYTYDSSGRLYTVQGLSGTVTYTYNQYGMTSIKDANGNMKMQNVYDAFGRVISQTDAEGNVSQIAHDDLNRVNTFTVQSTGERIQYAYNDELFIAKETYRDGTYNEYTYDEFGNVAAFRNRSGHVTTNTYDSRGNLLTVTTAAPLHYVTIFTYDANDWMTRIEFPDGGQHDYVYDSRGNLIEKKEKIDANNVSSTRYTYDSYGRVLTVTDAENRRTTFEYEGGSEPVKAIDGEGGVIQYGYDALGRVTSITTADGTTTLAYTGQDRVATITDASGAITRMKYDPVGNLIKQIMPEQYNPASDDGAGIQLVYDKLYNRIKEIDPLGHTMAYQYDPEGNLTKQIQPNQYMEATGDGTGTVYEYNDDDKVIRITYPSGQQARMVYDAVGNLVKAIDANHYSESSDSGPGMTYSYDSNNRLVEVKDPQGNVINRYVYDAMGRIVKSIDAIGYLSGGTDQNRIGTHYKYNLAGWLLETREPLRTDSSGTFYRVTKYVYDQSGKMLERKLSSEEVLLTGEPQIWNTISYTYDGRGNIVTITDSTGSEMNYTYDSMGRTIEEKAKLSDGQYRITGSHYNATGLMDRQWIIIRGEDIGSHEETVRAETLYSYDRNGRIISVTLPNGHLTQYVYDAAGRLIEVKKQVQEASLTETHVRATVVSPNLTAYPNQSYSLDVEIDADEIVKQFQMNISYDARLFDLISVSPVLQGVAKNHDAIGQISLSASNVSLSGKSKIATIVLKAKDNLQGIASVLIQPDSIYHNISGQTHAFTEAVGHSFSMQGPDMNRDGRVETNDLTFTANNLDMAFGHALFEYKHDINNSGIVDKPDLDYLADWLFQDKSSQLASVPFSQYDQKWVNLQYAISHQQATRSIKYTYDKSGNIIKETDSENRYTTYEYDALNRLASATDQDGSTMLYVYDEVGNLVKQVWPSHASEGPTGAGMQFVYDAMNRLVTTKNEQGTVIEHNVYNAKGQLLKQMDAGGYASAATDSARYGISYVYDLDDRVIKVTRPEAAKRGRTSAEYVYNALGHLVRATDGEGGVTDYTRDLWGRATGITDAAGNQTTYTYDLAGNVTSSTDGEGHTTIYHYNSMNMLASITDPLGQVIHYEYDILGRLQRMTDRNGLDTVYAYNADNLVTEQTIVQTGEKQQYLYQRDGSLLAAINGEMIDRFSYTPGGRLSGITRNGKTLISYDYNADGQVTGTTDATGNVTGYGYDLLGRLKTVNANGNLIATYQYNTNNMISQIQHASGTQSIFSYDWDNRATSVISKNKQGVTLDSHTYTYDNNGNKLSVTDLIGTTAYTYDPLQQLVKAVYPTAGEETFQYDRSGNRILRTIGGEQTSYTYDANNRLIEMLAGGESVAFTYDANGSMLSSTGASGVNTFQYDGFNRLIASMMADGSWMRYGYDPEGMRASISENGMMTSFIFDGPDVIAETTANGQMVSNYLRGYGLLAVEDPQGRIYNSLLNVHGDLTGLVNVNGEVVNSYSYDAFGQTMQSKELIANRFRYAGEQYDPITDNYYLRARHYAPSIGRFTQEDTYRGDGLNLYAYVGNNPVNYVDPTGYCKDDESGGNILQAVWNWSKKEVQGAISGWTEIHSSWEGAVDYWTMGALSDIEDYRRVSEENPLSFEQFAQAAYISIGFIPQGRVASGTGRLAKETVESVSQVSRNQAFRDAKEAAGIPKSAQFETHGYVFDGISENRTVYQFTVDGQKKYIILHEEDKLGRGLHFHAADDAKGSPFDKGRYNQYDGHFPEDINGFGK